MIERGVMGSYSFHSFGSIHLSMGLNMAMDTAERVCLHEIQHIYLDRVTRLGSVLSALDIERIAASQINTSQSQRMRLLTDTIYHRMIQVQEIYATNMELLFLAEMKGEEAVKAHVSLWPQQYQAYYFSMAEINNDHKLYISQKQQYIHLLCSYAMNLPVGSDQFIEALKSGKHHVSKYFKGMNHPSHRLQFALDRYKADALDDLEPTPISETVSFLQKAIQCEIIKYSANEFEKMAEEISLDYAGSNEMDEEIGTSAPLCFSSKEAMKFWVMLEEQITVFDFGTLKVLRGLSFGQNRDECFLVIKNSYNLDNPKENVYLTGHIECDDVAAYVGMEISSDGLRLLLQNKPFVAIFHSEYDHANHRPRYFDCGQIPLFVIITDIHQCRACLEEEKIFGEIRIGDLLNNGGENFFSMLFFRRANYPKTIFVFPTIRRLAKKVISEFRLQNNYFTLLNSGFWKLFSCFSNQDSGKAINWLFRFFTNGTGDLF